MKKFAVSFLVFLSLLPAFADAFGTFSGGVRFSTGTVKPVIYEADISIDKFDVKIKDQCLEKQDVLVSYGFSYGMFGSTAAAHLQTYPFDCGFADIAFIENFYFGWPAVQFKLGAGLYGCGYFSRFVKGFVAAVNPIVQASVKASVWKISLELYWDTYNFNDIGYRATPVAGALLNFNINDDTCVFAEGWFRNAEWLMDSWHMVNGKGLRVGCRTAL